MVSGDAARDLAVHLLRPRAVDIVGAQAGLHMPYGDLAVESSQGRGGACCGVAVYKHNVGLRTVEHVAHAEEHTRGNVIEVLPRHHDVEVIVGGDVEKAEHLVEHLAVLSGDAHLSDELIRAAFELIDKRRHLDGLRPRTENKQYLFHQRIFNFTPLLTLCLIIKYHSVPGNKADKVRNFFGDFLRKSLSFDIMEVAT